MDQLQNAIDRIVWALYARPRANPSYVEVLTVAEGLRSIGALTVQCSTGHYVLERHLPPPPAGLGGDLLDAHDIPSTRRAQLAAGETPTAQEARLWQRRWTQRALEAPERHDLPRYNIGTVRARSGEQIYWLATIDDDLGVELFGFACSVEEIFARFRATVLEATLPREMKKSLCR